MDMQEILNWIHVLAWIGPCLLGVMVAALHTSAGHFTDLNI